MPDALSPVRSAKFWRFVESAQPLAIERDEAAALHRSSAAASARSEGDVLADACSGIFAHRITILGFSTADLAYLRRIGSPAECRGQPGVAETALAFPGSAAQSKFQPFRRDRDCTETLCRLLRLRDDPARRQGGRRLLWPGQAARAEVIDVVNHSFDERLTAVPAPRHDNHRLQEPHP